MEASLWGRYLLIDLETSDCFDSADVTGHGWFQRKVQVLTVLAIAVLVGNNRAFTLSASPVDHWCKPPAYLSHLSEAAWKNVGIPLDANGLHSSCNAFLLPGSADFSNSSADEFACDAWDYDRERAGSSVISVWNLVCHRAWLLPAARAVRTSGAILATVAAGYAADHAGRKPVIIVATTVLLLSTYGWCIADSYLAYVVMGTAVSASAGALFVVTCLLFFELGTRAHRARQLCVAILAGYAPISLLFLALRQTRITWTLRQMTMLSPTVLAPLFYVFVVESPRWLISTKQFNRAEVEIAEAGAANRFVKHAEGVSIVKSLRDMAGPRVESLGASLVAVLGIAVVRRRAAIAFASSFAVTFTFHALTPTAGLTRALGGWVSSAAEAALYAATLLVFERVQRLVMLSANLSLLASCSCLASLAFRIGEDTFGIVLLVFARAFSLTGMVVNYIYVLELFPTALRGVFFCTSFAFGRLGATLAALLQIFYDSSREEALLGFVVFLTFNAVLLLVHITEPEEELRVASTAMPVLQKLGGRRWVRRLAKGSRHTNGAHDGRKRSSGEVAAAGKANDNVGDMSGSRVHASPERESAKGQTTGAGTSCAASFP